MLAAAMSSLSRMQQSEQRLHRNSQLSHLGALASLVEAQRMLLILEYWSGPPGRLCQAHLRSAGQEHAMYLSSGLLHCSYRLRARCSVWR